MIAEGVEAGYASKLIQYGWETITEALKHGGITNMMDRLSNPAKITAFITFSFVLEKSWYQFSDFKLIKTSLITESQS
jgi:ketol-acid reductoisomerase